MKRGLSEMAGELSSYFEILVDGTVVKQRMDFADGNMALNCAEEADKFLVIAALHVAVDHGALEHVERSDQGHVPWRQ